MKPLHPRPPEKRSRQYYRGLNNYQYYFVGSLLYLEYYGPQNPILIIKAPSKELIIDPLYTTLKDPLRNPDSNY